MRILEFLFWLSTLIPGFAMIQICFRSDMRRGLFGVLSWSFILTVALLTPLVVIAHSFHLSIQTVVIFYLLLVITGAIVLLCRYDRTRVSRWLQLVFRPEVIIVFIMIVITMLAGGGARWDHQMHAAKVLHLREFGFSLRDPYSPLDIIESKFHVNTLQAIHAIGSHLTKSEPLEMWFNSAWYFTLLGLGGLEFLAVSIFRRLWFGLVTILGAMFYLAANTGAALPTMVASFVIFPVIAAQLLYALDRPGKLGYSKVALSSLTLGAIHVGNWLVVIVCVFPVLILWGFMRSIPKSIYLRRSWKTMIYSMFNGSRRCLRRFSKSASAALMVALSTGSPFVLLSVLQPNYIMELWQDRWAWMLTKFQLTENLTLHILQPTNYTWMLPVGATGALLLAVRRRSRWRDGVIAAIFLTITMYMFNPLLFEPLIRLIPYWIVHRANHMAMAIGFVTIAGGLAWLLRENLVTRTSQLIFSGTLICFGLALFQPQISRYKNNRIVEQQVLRQGRELREAFGPLLTGQRALICADSEVSLLIPAVQSSAVMAQWLGNANPADEVILQRHADCKELINPQTSHARRNEIVNRYSIDFVLIRSDREEDAGDIAALGGHDQISQEFWSTYDQGGDFSDLGELVIERDWFRVYMMDHE